MSTDFIKKQQAFHNNPYIHPVNGKKLIFGNKLYVKTVKLYGLPDISHLINQLNADLINEIFIYADNKSLTSFLLVNHHTYQFSSFYKEQMFKQAMERELRHNHFKIGARITDCKHNYIITNLNKHNGTAVRVDLLGNKINDKFYSFTRMHSKENFTWRMSGRDVGTGIILCKYGPSIENINDKMLKYRFDNQEPVIGSYVLVRQKLCKGYYFHHEYVVKDINEKEMVLGYLDDVRSYICKVSCLCNGWSFEDKNMKIIRIVN